MSRFAKRTLNPVGPPSTLHTLHPSKKTTDASPSLVNASYMRPLERSKGEHSSRGLNEHQKTLLLTLQSQQKSQKKIQRPTEESKDSAAPKVNAKSQAPESVVRGTDIGSASANSKSARGLKSAKTVILGKEDESSAVDDDAVIKAEIERKMERPEVERVDLHKISGTPHMAPTMVRRATMGSIVPRGASPSTQQQPSVNELATKKERGANRDTGVGMTVTRLISVAANIRRQSTRWLALSASFWTLVVMDASRVATSKSIENLLEALRWRATGKVTSDEFSVIMAEWMRGDGEGEEAASSLSSAHQQSFSLFHMRVLLCDRGYKENDIDLLIGIVVHEANTGLHNVPISFESVDGKSGTAKKSNKRVVRDDRGAGSGKLESVSQRWLSLSEELFFVLDNSGYGFLRYDEVFFLSACLCSGLRGWTSQEELEGDLSLSTISTYATELLKEMGCILGLTAFNRESEIDLLLTGKERTKRRYPETSAGLADEALPSVPVRSSRATINGNNGNGKDKDQDKDEEDSADEEQGNIGDDSSEVSYTIHEADWDHSTKQSRKLNYKGTHLRRTSVKASSGAAASRRGSILGSRTPTLATPTVKAPDSSPQQTKLHTKPASKPPADVAPSKPFACTCVTLTAFKKWLLSKACTEDLLGALLEHVKMVVSKVRRLCRETHRKSSGNSRKGRDTTSKRVRIKGEESDSDEDQGGYDESGGHDNDDLDEAEHLGEAQVRVYQSMSSLEDASTLGAPKLWPYSVLFATGVRIRDYRRFLALLALPNPSMSAVSSVPDVVQFLMVDGEKHIPAAWRAAELDPGSRNSGLDDESSTRSADSSDDGSVGGRDDDLDLPGAGLTVLSSKEEEEFTVWRLYRAYKKWSSNDALAKGARLLSSPKGYKKAASARITVNPDNYLNESDSSDNDNSHHYSPREQSSSRRGVDKWHTGSKSNPEKVLSPPPNDPVAKMIRSALLAYKSNQEGFCSSLRAFAVKYLPPQPKLKAKDKKSKSKEKSGALEKAIGKVSALLLPEIENTLLELGLDVDEAVLMQLQKEVEQRQDKSQGGVEVNDGRAHDEDDDQISLASSVLARGLSGTVTSRDNLGIFGAAPDGNTGGHHGAPGGDIRGVSASASSQQSKGLHEPRSTNKGGKQQWTPIPGIGRTTGNPNFKAGVTTTRAIHQNEHLSNTSTNNNDDDDGASVTTEVSEWDDALNLHVRVRRRRSQILGLSPPNSSTPGDRPPSDSQPLPSQEPSSGYPHAGQEQHGGDFSDFSRQSEDGRPFSHEGERTHVLDGSGHYAGLRRPSQRNSAADRHVRAHHTVSKAHMEETKKKKNVLHFFQKLPRKMLGRGKSGGVSPLPSHLEEEEEEEKEEEEIETARHFRDAKSSTLSTHATPLTTPGNATHQGGSVNGHTLSNEEAHLFSTLLSEDDPRAQAGIVRQLQKLRTPAQAGAGAEAGNGNSNGNDNGYSDNPPHMASALEYRRSTHGHLEKESGQTEVQYGLDPADMKRRADRAEMKARAASPRTSFLSGLFNQASRDTGDGSIVDDLEASEEDDSEDGEHFGADVSAMSSPSRGGSLTPALVQDDDDDRSAGSATSISQMLQQGQTAGKYAQTLRSILRTMDKEDSSVQLESLEQVLKLGHAIALQEKAGEANTLPLPPANQPRDAGAGQGVESSGNAGSDRGRPPIPPSAKRRSPARALSPGPLSVGSAPTPGSIMDGPRRRSRAGIASSPSQTQLGFGATSRQGQGNGQGKGAELNSSSRRGPPIGGSISRPGSHKPTPKRWQPNQTWDSNTRVVSPAPESAKRTASVMTTPRSEFSLRGGLATPFSESAASSGRSIASRTTTGSVPGTANPRVARGSANKRVFGHRI